MNPFLRMSVPVYVTRPTAQGDIMTFSINATVSILVLFLATANAVAWGLIGIYSAVRFVI